MKVDAVVTCKADAARKHLDAVLETESRTGDALKAWEFKDRGAIFWGDGLASTRVQTGTSLKTFLYSFYWSWVWRKYYQINYLNTSLLQALVKSHAKDLLGKDAQFDVELAVLSAMLGTEGEALLHAR
eukprot:6045537-Amphidinium_carterae.2